MAQPCARLGLPDASAFSCSSSSRSRSTSAGRRRSGDVAHPRLAAGANVGITTGRLLELKAEAHNKLLASLTNAVGVPMDGWGDARFSGTLDLA